MTRVLESRAGRLVALVAYKAYADLKAEAARTHVGVAWWFLEPVMSMAVYFAVFSVGLRNAPENYVSFLLVGLVAWRWLQTAVVHGSATISSSANLIQQVKFPTILLPLASFLFNTFKFSIVFATLLIYLAWTEAPMGQHWLALPAVFAVQGFGVCGLALLAAGLTPFLPDLRLVIQNLLRLAFFLSGVFYDVEAFPSEVRDYFRLNPMTVVIEAYRESILEAQWPDWGHLALVAAAGAGGLVLGAWLLFRFDHVYPKLQN